MEMLEQAEKELVAQGWPGFELLHLARAVHKPLYEIQGIYGDKYGLVSALVDGHTAEIKSVNLGQDLHSYLFESLMARFDVLEHHRDAIKILRPWALRDLKLGFTMARRLETWIETVIDQTSLNNSWKSLRVKSLLLVYLAALDIWLVDESVDLSPTMATLDQRLNDFECVLSVG